MTTRARIPTSDLFLALFIGGSADIISVDELLRLPPGRRAELDVSPDSACISLVIDGEEQWGPRLSFGALGVLVDQLLPARDRLQAGQRAVIRPGGSDGPVTELVVLDPDGQVLTAMIAATDDDEVWQWRPDGADALHAFVDDHLEAMVERGRQLRNIAPVTAGTEAIIEALGREAERGARIVELLGPGAT